MAVASGKEGSIVIGAANELLFRSWSIDYNQDPVEITSYGDAGVRTYAVGLTTWSGSAEGFCDGTTVPVLDAAATSATFYDIKDTTSGNLWTGLVIVTGLSFNPSVDGTSTCNITFQGTGALAIA